MTPTKAALLTSAPAEVRHQALALLDEISRPLTVCEIERAFRDAGNSKTWSVRIASELRDINIIAITPKEIEQ